MLRNEVYEIVQDLAVQDNISVSKAAGILVEAALAHRSLWDQKTRKRIPAGMTKDPSFMSVTKADMLDGLPENVSTELVQKNAEPVTKEPEPELDADLLALAKKLQALKQLDLL